LATANDDYYNILTIDGGGIKGVITVTCIAHMEEYAYEYGVEEMHYPTITKYIDPEGQLRKRIPMKDLFDMFSGTSTGSILSAGMSLAKVKGGIEPKYWADDIRNIYIDNSKKIF
jgi:patatin-like phospholipase/acyl hydrolase